MCGVRVVASVPVASLPATGTQRGARVAAAGTRHGHPTRAHTARFGACYSALIRRSVMCCKRAAPTIRGARGGAP
eukprot:1741596-Prymnesium_polylepis.1